VGDNTLPRDDISITAYGMAIARAIESERSDALFCDPFARSLGGEQGENFLQRFNPSLKQAGLAIAIRTYVIDEILLQLARQAEIDTVLNLAAGLDTRPYRLALPPAFQWIEVDLPTVIDYKERQLATAQPVCAVESIKLDLTDIQRRNELFAQVNASRQNVLVLTEGLLAYLPSVQVGGLAADLRQYANFCGWLTELASPLSLRIAQKIWRDQFAAMHTQLQFAPSNGPRFFQAYGWQVRDFRLLLQEAQRLKRDVPWGWLLRRLPFGQEGVVLLERLQYGSRKKDEG
jgi:methyltransferase (TIGR00027 family)